MDRNCPFWLLEQKAQPTYYFKQTHIVPDGIDLDQMSSSFSADGVLVVKAPKKK
jgi:hypothetical protein